MLSPAHRQAARAPAPSSDKGSAISPGLDCQMHRRSNDRLGSGPAVCRMKNSTGWRPEADRVDRPGGPDHAGSGNVKFWDVASTQQIDAKHRKPRFAGLPNHRYRRQEGMTAVPSEAEGRRSSALRRLCHRPRRDYQRWRVLCASHPPERRDGNCRDAICNASFRDAVPCPL